MPSSWLLKTDPDTYTWAQLVADGKAVWDGVSANAALLHLRQMKAGDEAIIYHSGDDRAVVGIAKITRGAYPDPKLDDPRFVVIDIKPDHALKAPVTLAAIKAEKGLKDFGLVRISRLSCMPVLPVHRELLRKLGVK